MKKIAIIGAGPAGLTAALELQKAFPAAEITIYEQSFAVGGIARTVEYNGNRMDMGGHRFFSKDASVNRWWEEYGQDIFQTRERFSSIYYREKLFPYPLKLNIASLSALGFRETSKIALSYAAAGVRKLPETNLENFYINRFGRALYAMFFESYTEKLWGVHPRDISADWGAQRVKGLSLRKALFSSLQKKPSPQKSQSPLPMQDQGQGHAPGVQSVETSLIDQFLYPPLGPGQFWESVARKFTEGGGRILFGCQVTEIHWEPEAASAGSDKYTVKSIVYKDRKEKMPVEASCHLLLSSMPLCQLAAGMKGLPQEIADIALNLPYRDFITIGLCLNKSDFMPGAAPSGPDYSMARNCWLYIQYPQVKMGRIQLFNNWSPAMAGDPQNKLCLGLEYFCQKDDQLWNMTDDQLYRLGLEELARIGLSKPPESLFSAVSYHVERVEKAYPAYFGTYGSIDKLIAYLNRYTNLYCIGRNGQHRYNNMDHSMLTAMEAVKNITSGKGDKSNIWNVNTEKTYQEE